MSLSACRSDKPPPISIICVLDGHGGGDCTTFAGEKKYQSPSEMLNMVCKKQEDEAAFDSWCYNVPPKAKDSTVESVYPYDVTLKMLHSVRELVHDH